MHQHPSGRGFTLVELLVVVAVIALLIGLLVPALAASRRQAQLIQCQSNERQLAMGLTTHSVDHDGAYCTGPSDNRVGRGYGPIDEKGWLADLVNNEIAIPGDMLCPTHPAEYSQNLNLSRLNDNPIKHFSEDDQARLLAEGYNSNYTLAWYTAYTEVRHLHALVDDPKRIDGVRGPLHVKYLNKIAPSYVPLLATGRTDIEESFPIDGRVARAAKALTDGPLLRNGRWDRQDYDDWGPAHGSAGMSLSTSAAHNRTIANVAFADGHVQSFKDTSRDGEFRQVTVTIDGKTFRKYEDDDFDDYVFGGWLTRGDWLGGG